MHPEVGSFSAPEVIISASNFNWRVDWRASIFEVGSFSGPEVIISASQHRSLLNRVHPAPPLHWVHLLFTGCIYPCRRLHPNAPSTRCSVVHSHTLSLNLTEGCSSVCNSTSQLEGQSTLDFWLGDDCLEGGGWRVFTCFYPTRVQEFSYHGLLLILRMG